MEKVFIYWDNSNIFISAREAAVELEGENTRLRVRVHFRNLLELARAGREIEHAVAVGSAPPELRQVWNRLGNAGVTVQLPERGAMGRTKAAIGTLQAAMLRDGIDFTDNPGIVALLTGDGAGFADGVEFHADLERMHRRGWRIEVVSWRHSCSRRMREWAEERGRFVALDDFYESVTYLEPAPPGRPIAAPREAVPPDLRRHPSAGAG